MTPEVSAAMPMNRKVGRTEKLKEEL